MSFDEWINGKKKATKNGKYYDLTKNSIINSKPQANSSPRVNGNIVHDTRPVISLPKTKMTQKGN